MASYLTRVSLLLPTWPRRAASRPPGRIGALIVLIALCSLTLAAPAYAQFGGFNLGGSLTDKAKDAIKNQIAKSIAGDPPLLLDQKSAFSEAPAPGGFKPSKLKAPADLNRALSAGDYSVDVTFYCSEWSIHRPAQGLPYKLARVRGRMRLPICALLNRGTLQGVDEGTLNCAAWRIEAGVPLSQWPQADQNLVHKLIPDYENQLNGDYLADIKGHYDSTVQPLTHQSFDSYLGSLGDLGQQVLQLEQARQLLTDASISDDQLPDMLYQRTGSGPMVATGDASPSPWAEVLPGVVARYTIIEGYLGKNLLEFRVGASAGNVTLAEIMGTDETKWPKGPDDLIGYSIGTAAQIPIIVPIPDAGSGRGLTPLIPR